MGYVKDQIMLSKKLLDAVIANKAGIKVIVQVAVMDTLRLILSIAENALRELVNKLVKYIAEKVEKK